MGIFAISQHRLCPILAGYTCLALIDDKVEARRPVIADNGA
jgi:hypothetical protein